MHKTRHIDLSTAAGYNWQFQPEGGDWGEIAVPAGGWRAQGHTCDAGTYRLTLPITAEAAGQAIRVAFAAVNFGAEVYAGPDEDSLLQVAEHLNGWLPFTADLTDIAVPGKSLLLVVEVYGRNKYLREGKYLVPQGATWFDGLADGIIRGIELQIMPQVFVDDIFVRTSVREDYLQPEVTLCNAGDMPQTVTIGATLDSWNDNAFAYPTLPGKTVTLQPGERRPVDLGRTLWGLGSESYWWPNVPYQQGYRAQLHTLTVTLTVDGQELHTATQRFGFRQFEVQGNYYTLNGIHCNLRGDNQQEANFGTDAYGIYPGFGAPSAENPGWPQAVDNLLHAQFNVMRIHQIPATPYMLDVCDELGLMIVDESPIRGSENQEDFTAGRENMLACDRELTLRDRNHPSIVIWSAGNETWNERGLMLACIAAITAVDDTRPIIADGVPDLGWPIINMDHYIGGLGVLPDQGGPYRTDRPYGETECVWPHDNSWQGFAWMSTCTRIRRLKGNADIRNYVLNNAWSNYVPGQSPALQKLEKQIKNMQWAMEAPFTDRINPPLEDTWNHPLMRLMQKCFHPVTVCDMQFDEANKRSNENGDWPVAKPDLPAGATVSRELAVFNDEFSGDEVTVTWETRLGSAQGKVVESGSFTLRVPLGEFRRRPITFTTPAEAGELALVLRTAKNGETRFVEDAIAFTIVPQG